MTVQYPDLYHADLYRRALKQGLNRAQLAELSAHAYAIWRSRRSVVPILLFRIEAAGCDLTFYVRTDTENQEMTPLPPTALVATYADGQLVARTETAMTAQFDAALGLASPSL